MTLLILRPGELSPVPFAPSATAEYPLDSVLLVPYCSDQLHYGAAALDHAIRFPWLPVVIGTASTGLVANRLDGIANGLHLTTMPLVAGARVDAGAILGAVRSRGAPTMSQFSAYAGRRLGRSLEPLVKKALAGEMLTRSELRELSRYGRFGPVQWRGVYRLCCLHGHAWVLGAPLGRLAVLYGTTRKSVWSWSLKYLGVSWTVVNTMSAWEAIAERAVRRAFIALPARGRLPGSGGRQEA